MGAKVTPTNRLRCQLKGRYYWPTKQLNKSQNYHVIRLHVIQKLSGYVAGSKYMSTRDVYKEGFMIVRDSSEPIETDNLHGTHFNHQYFQQT